MLCRTGTPHGASFRSSSLSKFFAAILSSPFSDCPTHTNNPPTSLILRNHREVSPSVSSSLVSAICSLLSHNANQTPNLEILLYDYKEMLNSDIVLQILMNYRQLGRVRTIEFFSWAGSQMGFQFDDCVIEYMADFLGRRKLFDDMKCLLVTVFSHKRNISCRVFSICIRFLGRQGRVREALCLFQEMETMFHCKPDNYVYNNMLYVLCKKETSGELIDVALDIFHQIKWPDTYSYSNVLVGLCKFGRYEAVLQVFHEMGRVGLVPTRSAVNALIADLCSLSAKEGAIEKVRVKDARRPFTILVPNVGVQSGAIQPALGVFWAVHSLGLLPSTYVISRLIYELCRLQMVDEALEVLKIVEEKKHNCVEEGYSVVIQALCEKRLVKEASHLFQRMLSKGLKPKLVVYNSILCMQCKLGCLDEAQRVFEIMNKKRCLPDNVTYTALVHAYGEARNWEGAYDILIDMLGLGWILHFHTYSLVDKLLRECGQKDLSIKLKGKLESQILLKHCKMGQLQVVYEKLRSMLDRGFCPPTYVGNACEHAFQQHGSFKIVDELLQKMDKV
ncbi:hypothetical protein HS088_TW09G00783 [Tripterygium wilfordii]|uniref:Pentatricopeptide repeat-containing protein n=1 Tax=Tripterygium wilfordii TaxID=458696 RepID=A0A7J7D8M6_TRIWF|nr:pentatricopeptide repeat-containing protein At4g20090-like [Tripterygium wilfordii]XP_038712385.1 pentatricopeptide repeat-containing protein At4g20090-like [Tripterygium wilfordii]XP_038712386.1 pentatricopeptide repeat-containing protein At4g20090-like [Tripterygium wilfordii]XP_038712387.1 pentatricopeptide repeat-containing protein At4g20090-like [Tripterygium wilfordii]XP_038712388.1 pentatricopeptide repeat-containing protein At4g20090-like [Tripterygium wilfordii]KAF5742725.1 hypothe